MLKLFKPTLKNAKHCGEFLEADLRPKSKPNTGLAAVLSLIIPGAGQIYLGQTGTGLIYFFLTVVGYLFLIVPGLILHLVSIVAAASYKEPSTSMPTQQTANSIVTKPATKASKSFIIGIIIVLVGLSVLVNLPSVRNFKFNEFFSGEIPKPDILKAVRTEITKDSFKIKFWFQDKNGKEAKDAGTVIFRMSHNGNVILLDSQSVHNDKFQYMQIDTGMAVLGYEIKVKHPKISFKSKTDKAELEVIFKSKSGNSFSKSKELFSKDIEY